MAEKGQQDTRQQDSASAAASGMAETSTRSGGGAGRGAERAAEATERSTRAGAAAQRQGAEAGAEMLRRSSEAGGETMRHLADSATEAMQHGTQAVAASQHHLARSAAAQMEEIGNRMAQAMQETVRDMRAFCALPGLSGTALQDLRQGVTGLIDGVMRTNMRVAQEAMRMVSPLAAIELQRRIAAEYMDTLLENSAALLRAARSTADEALRPLEEHVQQRQQARQSSSSAWSAQSSQPASEGRVADVMERDVRLANPEDTVQRAAQLMREEDTGVLPVGEGDRLVGMVTDRDVALRLVAEGRDPRQTRVREVMTQDIRYVFEDEDLAHVAENMAEQQVRRLPVVNREKRLVGIVSLTDLAAKGKAHLAGRAMSGIARPSGQHTQAQAAE